MPRTATIEIADEVNVTINNVDSSTMGRVKEALTYYVPGYFHMPKYKLGHWSGKLSLVQNRSTYLHLLDEVVPIIADGGYEIEFVDNRTDHTAITDELCLVDEYQFNDRLLKGAPIVLRDYQVDAINVALSTGHGIMELATGAGKSLITGVLAHIYMNWGNVIVIVPSIDLALQNQSLYYELGLESGLWYGEMKRRQRLTVTTWQSLDNAPQLFDDVISVIVDEAHLAKGKVLKEILTGPARNVPFRFGCTGTLPKDDLFRQQIKSCLGPTIMTLKSWELRERGVLARSNVIQMELDDDSKAYEKAKKNHEDWKDEIDWLVKQTDRWDWIANFIQDLTTEHGNTLVFVPYINIGTEISNRISDSVYVHGGVKAKRRAELYEEFRHAYNQTMIATIHVASTGLDIPRIHNVVFVEIGKASIRILQSIGRGLRLASDKSTLNVIDIYGTAKLSHKHAEERLRIYREDEQPFEVIENIKYRKD